jgi:hypothetical protein
VTTETQQEKSYGVTFTKKVSDGNYGGEEISFWVSADVTPEMADTEKYDALMKAANIAKAAVYDHFKIEVAQDEAGVIREVVKAIKREFPGTTDVSEQAEAFVRGGTVRVKGTQHGELPSWLIEACAKDGVTEVYDNRADLSDPAKAKRPHFKATTGGTDAKAYWPPRGK